LGRSLREIDCRGRFGVTVLAVRSHTGTDDDYEIPDPDRRLAPGDVIALAGSRERLRALQRAIAETTR
jgi:Trk K+ transport system NAD-binding subunit